MIRPTPRAANVSHRKRQSTTGPTPTRLLSGHMTYTYACESATDDTVNDTLNKYAAGGWVLDTATAIVWGQCTKINPGKVYHYLYFRK